MLAVREYHVYADVDDALARLLRNLNLPNADVRGFTAVKDRVRAWPPFHGQYMVDLRSLVVLWVRHRKLLPAGGAGSWPVRGVAAGGGPRRAGAEGTRAVGEDSVEFVAFWVVVMCGLWCMGRSWCSRPRRTRRWNCWLVRPMLSGSRVAIGWCWSGRPGWTPLWWRPAGWRRRCCLRPGMRSWCMWCRRWTMTCLFTR